MSRPNGCGAFSMKKAAIRLDAFAAFVQRTVAKEGNRHDRGESGRSQSDDDLLFTSVSETLAFYRRPGFRRSSATPAEGTPTHVEFRPDHFELAIVDIEHGAKEHGPDIEVGGTG
ncbi:MAG: hypothetical protein R2845_05595 [Thermomicrobiales bacterium]